MVDPCLSEVVVLEQRVGLKRVASPSHAPPASVKGRYGYL